MGISLPKFPKGKQFEEYISAFFQSAGYFIERNIIQREVEEILELDIITTDYSKSPPQIKLLEVKSGDWGFPDLFKVRGWMDYLNILKGLFIVAVERHNSEFIKQKAKILSIDLAVVSDLSKTGEILKEFTNNTEIGKIDIATWRYSYWVERNLLKLLNQKKKLNRGQKRYPALSKYFLYSLCISWA